MVSINDRAILQVLSEAGTLANMVPVALSIEQALLRQPNREVLLVTEMSPSDLVGFDEYMEPLPVYGSTDTFTK